MDIIGVDSLQELEGKRVLLRADLNVPLATGKDGERTVADDFRIQATVPTIDHLVNGGAAVTICSHLGRPKGPDPAYSIAPVARVINEIYPGVTVLENLRFDPREVANDPDYAAELAAGMDLYVNDAFGASHRSHASIVGVPKLLPAFGGVNLVHEVRMLSVLLEEPERPYVAVVGGAKVSDKLALLNALVGLVDRVIVGGGMCFTFLAALGEAIGSSLVEVEQIDTCRRLLETGKIMLPSDILGNSVGDTFGPGGGGEAAMRFSGGIPEGFRGLDIGPDSLEAFSAAIGGARSILWNGPMGVFEDPRFNSGTFGVARAVASSRAYSVVGGGDSVAAIREAGLDGAVSHLSTGGGAALEFIENGDLPGLAALRMARVLS